jgi:hypothetical protein
MHNPRKEIRATLAIVATTVLGWAYLISTVGHALVAPTIL